MQGTLSQEGVTSDATKQRVEQCLAGGRYFYLDLDDGDEEEEGQHRGNGRQVLERVLLIGARAGGQAAGGEASLEKHARPS